jgi:hypothetical protein
MFVLKFHLGFFFGLENKERENYCFYEFFLFFLFFLFLAYLSYSFIKNFFLLNVWMFFVWLLWLSSTFRFLKKYGLFLILVEERGYLLGFFIFVLELLGKLIQVLTLFLRISVNLLLGEVLKFFFSNFFFGSILPLFFCFYEFFVFRVQRMVFFVLLIFYYLNI